MSPTGELQEQQKREREVIVKFLRAWYGAAKNFKLYTANHPSSAESCQKMLSVLEEIFRQRLELTILHTDGIFMVEDFMFIEESLLFYDLLKGIEDHRMAAITFLPGITGKELTNFCLTLLQKAEDDSQGFVTDHIRAPAALKSDDGNRKKDARVRGGTLVLRAAQIHEEWVGIADRLLSKLLEEQNIGVAEIALSLDKIIDLMHQCPQSMSVVVSLKPTVNLSAHHAVNTMICAMFMGLQLGYDTTALKMLAIAALVHDVGRHLLPSDFSADYKLAAGDADFVRLHTRDGASFLAGVPGVPMSIVRAALEHHLGYDGLGYPPLPGSQKPHPFSKILALADFVSWRTVSEHNYRKPVPMHRVVRSMMRRAGSQFDPFLVKLLAPFFGLYPSGTRVKLSTGREAVVIEPNTRNIARPAVALLEPDGSSTYLFLGALSDQVPGGFACSIERILGVETEISPFIDLLPEVTEKVA
jgi:HD-GYP domain-containing protein (c-di-GMP phosphodiesterase class II)